MAKPTTVKPEKPKARKATPVKATPVKPVPKQAKAKEPRATKPKPATSPSARTVQGEKTAAFADTFAALRGVLQRHGKRLITTVDKPGDFQVASPTLTDRIGRPLFVAGVLTKKTYVSFHLLPLYMDPALLAAVSPALRKRMQGKACFNFTAIEADQLKELSALLKIGVERYKTLQLPWAKDAK